MVVHNSYGRPSGEEMVVDSSVQILRAKGHTCELLTSDSRQIQGRLTGRARAFFAGIYSQASRHRFRLAVQHLHPDLVHIHNLYPMISPSILGECTRMALPVVMTVHNYRLICPNGLQMPKRKPHACLRCLGGREYWCLLKNCEADLAKSLGYAIRGYAARKARLFLDNVWIYACLARHQRDLLASAGFPPDRLELLPNMVRIGPRPPAAPAGDCVTFVGRVSPEKGIAVLLEAAKDCRDIPFKIAGGLEAMPQVARSAPPNCTFLGFIRPQQITDLYRSSRFVVVPSIWQEPFGLAAAEAQAAGRPVICSRVGALPEIVEDGVTGLWFEPGNAKDLALKIQYLWHRPWLSAAMGQAGWEKMRQQYCPDRHYARLVSIYHRAIQMGPPSQDGRPRRNNPSLQEQLPCPR